MKDYTPKYASEPLAPEPDALGRPINRALEGDLDLWKRLEPSEQKITALAASLINLSGPSVSLVISRQNLIHLGLLVQSGVAIAWNAPLFPYGKIVTTKNEKKSSSSKISSGTSLVSTSNPSLFAGLLDSVELVYQSRATATSKSVRAKHGTIITSPAFSTLAFVWKNRSPGDEWSWFSSASESVAETPAAIATEVPLWECAAKNGWWSLLRLSPSGFMADRFDHPVIQNGCLNPSWWSSFCGAAAHRPDWAAGKESLIHRRAAYFWKESNGSNMLAWLEIFQDSSLSDPPFYRNRGSEAVGTLSQFFWDRPTALLVLGDLVKEAAKPVKSLALSFGANISKRLSRHQSIALVYARTPVRTLMVSMGVSKISLSTLNPSIHRPAPEGKGWALWDVLKPSDVEDLIIRPNCHGIFLVVAKECREADINGGTSRAQNQTGSDVWKGWVKNWPMDQTPTKWLMDEFAVLAAESQTAFSSTGVQPEFIHRTMVREALADELVGRLFRSGSSEDIFWEVLDCLALSVSPGDILVHRLIREGNTNTVPWGIAAKKAGGWPFASPEALERLYKYNSPQALNTLLEGLDGPVARQSDRHQDSRAFRMLIASLAIAPLEVVLPHLEDLPRMVNRFVSGWSHRARPELANMIFMRATRLPVDNPMRPVLSQAAWTAVCLAATSDKEGTNSLSANTIEQVSNMFVKYGKSTSDGIPDRQVFLGPFHSPSSLLPMLKKAAENILSPNAPASCKKKIPRVEIERIILRLTSSCIETEHTSVAKKTRRM